MRRGSFHAAAIAAVVAGTVVLFVFLATGAALGTTATGAAAGPASTAAGPASTAAGPASTAAGLASTAADPVSAEDGATYGIGETLAFDVEHGDDGYQVRDDGNELITVVQAEDGAAILETGGMAPGTYTLEHGNTGTVEYTFSLAERTETPTATPTPDPAEEPLEHRIVWAEEIPREQRDDAVTTTGGVQWYGELLLIETGDDALLEVYDGDGNHVRTLVPHRGDAYLPTRELRPGMYRIDHEDDGRLFSVGVVRQSLDAEVIGDVDDDGDAGGDDVDGGDAVVVTSNRRGYDVALSSETIPAEYLADGFVDASLVTGVTVGGENVEETVVIGGLGSENRLAFDPDELPEGTHTLTVTVVDAGVSVSVEVTGTGPAITAEPATESGTDADGSGDGNDGDGNDGDGNGDDGDGNGGGGTASDEVADDGSASDDRDFSAPGFGTAVTLLAVLTAALLARARR